MHTVELQQRGAKAVSQYACETCDAEAHVYGSVYVRDAGMKVLHYPMWPSTIDIRVLPQVST